MDEKNKTRKRYFRKGKYKMNNYKFNISKLDRLNKKLRQKPYKYIYKEMMPKKLFNKIPTRKVNDFLRIIINYQ